LSDDEITRVTEFVATDSPQFARELIELKTKDEEQLAQPGAMKSRDELYEAAVDIVVRERRGSVSLLQRCLGIGYGRAARLIDFMAEDKIVGEYNGAQAREVLISIEDWEAMSGGNSGEGAKPQAAEPAQPLTAATVQPRPRRVTRILPGPDEADESDSTADEALEEDELEADKELDDETDEWEEDEETDSDLWEEDEAEDHWADGEADDSPIPNKRAESA
jgi:S-DNA-T family DNA segregation ATPase FtsK/SpoIIIE